MSPRPLTDAEALRFGRNVLLPEIGLGGQETLRGAAVRIDDLGAVGSAAALYLAAAGVGALALCDTRAVTAADLAGTLYRAADVGTARARAARGALCSFDPGLLLSTPDFTGRVGDGGAETSGDSEDSSIFQAVVVARDVAEDRCALSVDGAVVTAEGGPGPQALLAGALAAAEVVKVVLGIGAPIRTEALP